MSDGVFVRQGIFCPQTEFLSTSISVVIQAVLPQKRVFFCLQISYGCLKYYLKSRLNTLQTVSLCSLPCKIFETMISPILTYNSEVWDLFIKSDFEYWNTPPIEESHLYFCKRYLQVNNKASNIACRAELGQYPLITKSYLQSKEQSSSVTQPLVIISVH